MIALAPYRGRGTRSDPFTPHLDQPWSAIDVRPDPTNRAGFAVVEVAALERTMRKLGDSCQDRVALADVRWLRNRLHTDASEGRVDVAIARLLRRPTNGLPPLRPCREGAYEVFLGGACIYREPVIRGGASDNFTRANESPIAAPWTNVLTGGTAFNLTSNELVKAAVSNDTAWYYAGAQTSNDQYSQGVEVAVTNNDWGPMVRASQTPGPNLNGYIFDPFGTGSGGAIGKFTNGGFTNVSAGSFTYSAGDVIRLEANGTTLTPYKNGVVVGAVGPATDNTHPSGEVGVFIYESSGRVKPWAGGNLTAPTTIGAVGTVDYDVVAEIGRVARASVGSIVTVA